MSRPKLLDLFCGAGGCSVGFDRAGFDVTGVDRDPHPDYPFPMIIGDAMSVLDCRDVLDAFDVVAASPPCPRYSTITPKATRDKHPDLIGPCRDLMKAWGGPYVIENVGGAARVMDHPIRVCGSAFGLGVRRHRLFESNLFLTPTECFHEAQGRPIGVYGDHAEDSNDRRPNGTRRGTRARTLAEAQQAMGIDWMTAWDDLTDAIPPAYTEFIGAQLIEHLAERAA